jgi:hypothetical protein
MPDKLANTWMGATGPLERAVAVTPAAADLTDVSRAIYVGTSGSLIVRLVGDPTTDVTLPALAAGIWHPMRVVRVSVGGTATGVFAGY